LNDARALLVAASVGAGGVVAMPRFAAAERDEKEGKGEA
jgi:hypothetical protein